MDCLFFDQSSREEGFQCIKVIGAISLDRSVNKRQTLSEYPCSTTPESRYTHPSSATKHEVLYHIRQRSLSNHSIITEQGSLPHPSPAPPSRTSTPQPLPPFSLPPPPPTQNPTQKTPIQHPIRPLPPPLIISTLRTYIPLKEHSFIRY